RFPSDLFQSVPQRSPHLFRRIGSDLPGEIGEASQHRKRCRSQGAIVEVDDLGVQRKATAHGLPELLIVPILEGGQIREGNLRKRREEGGESPGQRQRGYGLQPPAEEAAAGGGHEGVRPWPDPEGAIFPKRVVMERCTSSKRSTESMTNRRPVTRFKKRAVGASSRAPKRRGR